MIMSRTEPCSTFFSSGTAPATFSIPASSLAFSSAAALCRYLWLTHGLTGILEVTRSGDRYGTAEPSADRYRSIDGLAWAPADATTPLDYTRGTVAAYDAWANGEVYGYTVVAPDGRDVASCWDFYADPDEPITMTRYYAAKRTFWVDPVSGTIVKSEEHANHYYARDPVRPETTMADYTVTSTEATVESQVASARDERDRIALWSRILPITFTAAGLIALVAGALLGSFGVRAEVAAQGPESDSDGGGFFAGRRDADTGPMPAAEAETEKLPAQRPQLDRPAGPPESSPPDRGTPDSAPDQP